MEATRSVSEQRLCSEHYVSDCRLCTHKDAFNPYFNEITRLEGEVLELRMENAHLTAQLKRTVVEKETATEKHKALVRIFEAVETLTRPVREI